MHILTELLSLKKGGEAEGPWPSLPSVAGHPPPPGASLAIFADSTYIPFPARYTCCLFVLWRES